MFSKPFLTLAGPLLASIFCNLPEITASADAIEGIVQAYKAGLTRNEGEGLLIVSDFNGVLFKKEKNTDINPDYMRSLRDGVVRPAAEKNHIIFYVSSSKPASQLKQLLGEDIPNLGLSAEHSMQVKDPDQAEFRDFTALSPDEAGEILGKISTKAKEHGFEIKKTGHVFSRNFISNEAEQHVEWFQNMVNEIDKRFEAVFDNSNQFMVASGQRGKEHLVEKLLNEKQWKFAISLGDKPADVGMHQAMEKKGFAGIIVGPNLESEAKEKGFYHLTGPEEVHILLKRLTEVNPHDPLN